MQFACQMVALLDGRKFIRLPGRGGQLLVGLFQHCQQFLTFALCRIDLLRKKFRVQEDVDVDDLWDLGTDAEMLENEVYQKRIEVDVRESLLGLPVEQRQIIAKVYMEGKSHSEVAEELGLPLGTEKSRVRLAMSKLKVMLDR